MGKRKAKPLEDRAGVNTVWISLRIDAAVARRIDEAAKQQDRSRSSIVRRLIVKHHEELLEQPA